MNSAMPQYVLTKPIVMDKTTANIAGCLTFALLTAIGAYVRIPLFFTPVPITLQTFFVLLSGAILGRKWGALSQVLYILAGIFGIPVFQGYGYGLAHILGPTGGYLFGFICASYAVGYVMNSVTAPRNLANILLAMSAGLSIVYLCGVSWLKLLLGINFKTSLIMGLYPFLPGEAIKVISASYILLNCSSITSKK